MKIRSGFVSNSNSSSFIVFYSPIDFNELDYDKLDNIYIQAGIEEHYRGYNFFP